MIKVVFCLRRRPASTVAEFQSHWLNIHAPLVQKHRKTLRILRYVQVHTDNGTLSERLRQFRGSPAPFDGIAEIWYENREALEGLGGDPEARTASRELRDDEVRFIDLTCSPIWVAEEKEIVPAEAAPN